MYLSAQKVRDSAGAEGVNVFAYTHQGVDCPGVDWTAPDVGYVADHCPGRVMAAIRSVTAKQPHVLAFLDVAVADGLRSEAVARLVQSAAAHWPGHGWPMTWHAGPLGLRFYAVRALRTPGTPDAAFRELQDALLPILGVATPKERGATTSAAGPAEPIVVVRHRTPVGFRFELSPDTRKVLTAVGAIPGTRSVSVSEENLEAFQVFAPLSIESEVVQLLSGLQLDEIDELAGAIVVDGSSRKPIWESPGRSV
jgi:hypothetical protein